MSNRKIEEIENEIRECYSTWGERYYAEYYEIGGNALAHVDLMRAELRKYRPKSLIDIGCGPASMLRHFLDMDLELYGFDLTIEMVEEAKKYVESVGLESHRIWQGSALDPAAYGSEVYDSAICFGVMPHIPAETDFEILSYVKRCLTRDGVAFIQARNELFSLFTMNRPTSEFIFDRLVAIDGLMDKYPEQKKQLKDARDRIEQGLRMDLPPIRKGYEGERGYDQVLSRLHNPFVLKQQAIDVGFRSVDVLFYNFHILPPMLSRDIPDLFRAESELMEAPSDWRGHFMASSFVLKAEM